MPRKSTWYDKGFAEALEGFCDAPYQPGNPHYASYLEGNADGQLQLIRNADRARIVHLDCGPRRLDAALCGAIADVEHVTCEINEVTCDDCYDQHEDICNAMGEQA